MILYEEAVILDRHLTYKLLLETFQGHLMGNNLHKTVVRIPMTIQEDPNRR